MTKINLLPWREQQRKARKFRFIATVALTFGLAILFVAALHIYDRHIQANQKARNDFLQSEINKEQTIIASLLIKKKEQNAIESELHFLFSLREKSYSAVHLLDELAKVVPEGVTFNKIIREDHKITIIGKAKSNLEVTLLMKNFAKTNFFKQPQLNELSAKTNLPGEERNFQLKIEMRE